MALLCWNRGRMEVLGGELIWTAGRTATWWKVTYERLKSRSSEGCAHRCRLWRKLRLLQRNAAKLLKLRLWRYCLKISS